MKQGSVGFGHKGLADPQSAEGPKKWTVIGQRGWRLKEIDVAWGDEQALEGKERHTSAG